MELHAERPGRCLQASRLGLGTGISRVDEHSHDGRRGDQLVQQLQPFGAHLHVQVVTPVTLPPGRFRLATRPVATGSSAVEKTIGMVVVAALAACAAGSPRENHRDPSLTSSAASAGRRS